MSPRRTAPRGGRDTQALSARRLRIALVLLMILITVLAGRLIQLQLLDRSDLAARAAKEGMVQVVLPAKRGEIVDRTGAVLAVSAAGKMIVADPTMTIAHAAEIAKILTTQLGLDYVDTLATLAKDRSGETPIRFAFVARRVPADKARQAVAAANKAGWPGLFLRDDPIRNYPGNDIAANLLGFMNGNGKAGGGLEQSFNALLSGHDGKETFQGGDGAKIPLADSTTVDPVNGTDLHLTIDRDMQLLAQRAIQAAVTKAGAESGTAVAIDVESGQVLALADYPSFDANKPAEASSKNRGARSISDVYEPGSTEKVLTSAALIQEGLVTPATKVVVPGVVNVLGHDIHDVEAHGTEQLTLAGIIARSSNIGMVKISSGSGANHQGISSPVLGNYLKMFGLGRTADVGMPGESQGLLPDPAKWNALTHANVAFGQGLSVTAIQMAAAINTIANGGLYVAPSLILGEVKGAAGKVVGSDAAVTRRVVSEATAKQVAEMMEMVTASGVGTAPNAMVPGYRVAGKTGTAQEVGEACRCYDHTAVSFAGFAPADKPRFTVYVVIERPRAGSTGFSTAVPVFRELMGNLLQKYAVPPTGSPAPKLPTTW